MIDWELGIVWVPIPITQPRHQHKAGGVFISLIGLVMVDPPVILPRDMLNKRMTIWATWTVLLAQTLVLVLGHGRVVVCHDENGSSHIELVNEDACKLSIEEPCAQDVKLSDAKQWNQCSGAECVDELFEVSGTLRSARESDLGASFEFQSSLLLSTITVLALVEAPETVLDTLDLDDKHALDLRHRSIRTTILVL